MNRWRDSEARRWADRQWLRGLHRLSRLRLAWDRAKGRLPGVRRRPRVLTTACWRFPIYSQNFVYQELTQLLHRGYDLKFLYSELERNDRLPAQFAALWRGRRRLFLNHHVWDEDLQHYRARMPERVDALIALLSSASGLSPEEVRGHHHVRQSFSYTRVVEAFQPRYLHSYFFYEGTLFTLVASYLLGIPRGVSCYADHVLKDYHLKVVALHLRQCSLIVATSRRIKRELLEIAPGLDPDRVLVKPNAINASRFPVMTRDEPAPGAPYRLVCVSRLDPKKGIVYLVRALRLLRDEGLRVEAHIVGSVDPDQKASVEYAAEIEAEIRALQLEPWVHLEGRQAEPEVRAFLQRSHLFVAPFVEMPSGDKDGIPTTLLEAMATGQAVVATDAGSITEVVQDGQDGIIVPQRDSRAMATAIAGLLADAPRRTRLGARAAEKARAQFDVSVCEQLMDAAVQRVLSHGFSAAIEREVTSMYLAPPPEPLAAPPPPERPAAPLSEQPFAAPAPEEPFAPSLILCPESRNPLRLPASTLEAVLTRPWRPPHAAVEGAGSPAATASLIIVTFNNLVFNRMCLESVVATTDGAACEIIVVDNSSTDGTTQYLQTMAAACPQLRLVLNDRNRGFAPAVNQGLLEARGDVIVLLNNDTVVPDDWLPRLLRHLDSPSAGLVGPVTNRAGNEAQVEVPYTTYGGMREFARAQAAAYEGKAFNIRTPAMFCVAMRRDVYERVGALDERFEIGLFEDDDYAVRVRQEGYTVRCAEDVFVHHFGQASFGQLSGDGGYGTLFHANRARWEEKWGRPWQPYERRSKPAYEGLLAEIRGVVRETLPADATIAVVSKGDNSLLELAGRSAWHFPQDEHGQYAGYHPRNSADVIAMVEALRAKGADYFLLPATSMWWLDHYGAFAEYMRTRCRVVVDDPSSCLIVKLPNGQPAPAQMAV